VSKKPGEDSIAEKLKGTEWDYSQRDDSKFLLAPIGKIFGTFCWDGKPERIATIKRRTDDSSDER
jgi:hypothetical protein